MTVHFETALDVAAPPETVFAESLRVGSHLGSMKRYEETSSLDAHVVLGLGEAVTWRARHFGVTWTMTSRIVEHDPPVRFVDEQVRGPFAWFRHEHRIEPNGGATRLVAVVSFAAPLGLLGRVVEALFLGRYVRRLIEERNAYLKASVEARG
jgi:ligand-binding SRPBCC domain-containing protein